MASPSRNSLALIAPVLTSFSLEYTQERLVTENGTGMGLTPDFFFPRMAHRGQGLSATYTTYDIQNRFNIPIAQKMRRAPNTDYTSIDWDISSGTYVIEDYGVGKTWDDNEVSAQLSPVQLERDTAGIIADLTLLAYSVRINAIVNSATITQTATAAAIANGGSAAWDVAGSNPIGAINTATNTIYQATGIRPNRMVMGWDVWINGIMNNDEMISRIQAGNNMAGNADITPRLVGDRLFGLDMRVDTGIIDTAVKGQTASLSTSGTGMIGTNVIVFYATPAPTVRSRTLGFTAFTEWFVNRKWDVKPKSHRVTVSHMTAEELVDANLAYRITSVVT